MSDSEVSEIDDDSYMPEPPENSEEDEDDEDLLHIAPSNWAPLTASLISAVALETKTSYEEAEAVLKAYRDIDEAIWVLKNS